MLFVFLLFCLIKSRSTHTGLRIYGGRDANPNEFPYVVAMRVQVKTKDESGEIMTKYIPKCSGALLSSTWCLTAAHCIGTDFNKGLKTLPAGQRKVLTYQDLSKISEIIWGIMQPSYKGLIKQIPFYPNDDIGLLRSEPMVLNQYAKLSALQYTSLTGFEAISVGYGLNQEIKEMDSDIYRLNNTRLKVLKTAIISCPKQLTSYMRGLCITNECEDLGAVCGGDSGSPLVHASGVVGVNSLGYPNCNVTESFYKTYGKYGIGSGVAAPISPHIDWIVGTFIDPNKG